MSKGMWTKHFTCDGKVFYFNAALNRSTWNTPTDAVIHEAPNAKPPSSPILNHLISATSQENPQNVVSNIHQPSPIVPLTHPSYESNSALETQYGGQSFLPVVPNMIPNMSSNTIQHAQYLATISNSHADQIMAPTSSTVPLIKQTNTSTTNPPLSDLDVQTKQIELDIQAKIDAALLQRQKELASASSKRLKKNNSTEQDGNSSSTYLKQKNDLQQLAGSKGGEDASKWLVR